MATFYTTPQSISLAGVTNGSWSEVNSGVPAGATGVILNFVWSGTNNGTIAVRMHGSTDNFTNADPIGGGAQCFYTIGVDSGGNFDLFTTTSPATDLTCYVVGYFGSEATFFTNAVVLGALTSTYANFNMASSCPGALAVFLEQIHGYQVCARQNGSTDASPNSNSSQNTQHILVGVDSGQIFQAKATTAPTSFLCHGYMTSGIVWNTNEKTDTALVANSFVNLNTETNAIGYLYYVWESTIYNYTICGTGANTTTYNPFTHNNLGNAQAWAGGSQAMIKASGTTGGALELAYFTAAGGPTIPPLGALMGVGI